MKFFSSIRKFRFFVFPDFFLIWRFPENDEIRRDTKIDFSAKNLKNKIIFPRKQKLKVQGGLGKLLH